MTRRIDRLLILVLALAVILAAWSGVARADVGQVLRNSLESNYRPYLVGTRAAGMGGAFTALADDASGPYYNPGGLGFVKRSQLSVSGSVYGSVTGTLHDALGDGHNFAYTTMNTFPSTVGGILKMGDEDAPHVVSFSALMPNAISIDDRDHIGSDRNAYFSSNQQQDVWVGGTYAHRMGNLSLGASAFVIMGTHRAQMDLTYARDSAILSQDYMSLATRTDEDILSFVGAVGARWDVLPDLHLGAAVFTPAWGTGSRREFVKFDSANATTHGMVVLNRDNLHASPTQPLRVQLGAAWSSGRWTLAADAIYLAPREVVDDAEYAPAGLDRHIVRNGVLNGSIGAEYLIADAVPLRAGFFTDYAASPTPDGDAHIKNTTHVDRYGGSLSIGYRTEHTSTDLGGMISGGSGSDVVPVNLDYNTWKRTDSTQMLFYAFLGTSYEF